MMKKFFRLFIVSLMSMGLFTPAQAAELTIYEGTATDRTIPINTYYLESVGTQSQVIYPAEKLTEMIGRPITSMRFYINGMTDASGGQVAVSLGIVEQRDFSTNQFVTEGLTRVATISIPNGVTDIVIPFDEPFVYNGGNLLFDSYVEEAGDFGYAYFLGTNPFYSSGKSRSTQVSFIPKTTFEYTPAEYAATVTPTEVAFHPQRIGNEEEMSVVIKNVGQNPFTPAFNVQAPFSVDAQPAELVAGESMTVPVKFAPTAEGNFAGVLTIDCGAAGTFQVALSGRGLPEADEYTVCGEGGSLTTSALPVYGLYYDFPGGEGQMIYPAEKLTDFAGKEIISLTFYPRDGLAFYNGNVQFSLKETEQTVFEDNGVPITGTTVVANVVPERYAEEFVITFDEPYKYNGGNLVIATVVTEAGNFGTTNFYGESTQGLTAYYTYSSNFGHYTKTDKFLPKVTFACKKDGGEQPQGLRGDVDDNDEVAIADVSALIDYLLTGETEGVNLDNANCNLDGEVGIADVSALIDYLLTGSWD